MKYPKLVRRHNREFVDQIDKIRFYEYDSPIGPLFTACLLFSDNGVLLARGVAICSVQDGFDRKYGRNRALGRAIKALKHMGATDPIYADNRGEDLDVVKSIKIGGAKQSIKVPRFLHVNEASRHFAFKSEYAPSLTQYEQELLNV